MPSQVVGGVVFSQPKKVALNSPQGSCGQATCLVRPNQLFGSIRDLRNFAWAEYNGLTLILRQRVYHGLSGQARQRAWWEAYGDALPNAYETYIGFEAEASSIYTYEAQVVPGLLQTAEYTSAIMQAELADDRPEIIGQRVQVRMARQAVLTRNPPPELWAVMDEDVVRRPIGGRDVLRRQLLRLAEVSERPNVTLQILPFGVGAHRGLSGSFIVLEFPDGTDESLVYCEGLTGGVFRSKPAELRTYWMAFEALRTAALSPKDSIALIQSVVQAKG